MRLTLTLQGNVAHTWLKKSAWEWPGEKSFFYPPPLKPLTLSVHRASPERGFFYLREREFGFIGFFFLHSYILPIKQANPKSQSHKIQLTFAHGVA